MAYSLMTTTADYRLTTGDRWQGIISPALVLIPLAILVVIYATPIYCPDWIRTDWNSLSV